MQRKKYVGILIGIFLWGVYAILLMVRTSLIIDDFGSEINAINQSAQQIFNYFILFESGTGAAYLYKMYGPMAINDKEKILSLYKGLSISMRKIAIKMCLVVVPVAIIYAAIMDRERVGYFTAFLIIVLLGLRFIIPYFISVNKKTLLTLYERKYLVDIIDSVGNIVIVLLELLLIWKTNIPIEIVLCIGCLINILLGIIYEFVIRYLCGYKDDIDITPSFDAEHMTKDILFHQFATLINSNTDTFLLSIVNIQAVTIYQAYRTIQLYSVQMINRFSEAFRASFGIRLANNDKNVFRDFQRLLTVHMAVATIVIAVFITNINPFIGLWIGKEFTLGYIGIILFAFAMLSGMINNAIYIIRDGRGLYKESKGYTAKEAIMNLIMSIVLVKYLEIEGVMFATVLSVYCNIIPGNSNLVFREIFHKKNTIMQDFVAVILTIVIAILIYKMLLHNYKVENWTQLLISVFVQTFIAILSSGVILGIYKMKYILKA